MTTIRRINQLKSKIVRKIEYAIRRKLKSGKLHNYQIVWRQLQKIAAAATKDVLTEEFPDSIIEITKSKSSYPDIKMTIGSELYALDIKTSESKKDPWYDAGRVDTVQVQRLNKYVEEWEIVLKYDKERRKYLQTYFNMYRETVGKDNRCNGVKYRPYDGKIRPKNWLDFERNKIHWRTKAEFLKGVMRSRKARWKNNVSKYLCPILNKREKDDYVKLFQK